MTVVLVFTDLRDLLDGSVDPFAMPALKPGAAWTRPQPDDQIRPDPPMTRPVAPDERGAQRTRPPARRERGGADALRLGTHGAAFADGTITPRHGGRARRVFGERAREGRERDRAAFAGRLGRPMRPPWQAIREKGLDTRVLPDGYCASSCPLVFAAGRSASPTQRLGSACTRSSR